VQSTDRVQTRDGQPLEVRELHAEDAREFGRFFAGLGAETRSYFGPHPLDAAEAARLCAAQPEPMARRIVAIADGLIAGYFILELGVRDEDADRYRARGQELNPGRVATLAPVMADDWQNRGVAGAVFPSLLRVASCSWVARRSATRAPCASTCAKVFSPGVNSSTRRAFGTST
jgi:diamine N-acetyltransferase